MSERVGACECGDGDRYLDWCDGSHGQRRVPELDHVEWIVIPTHTLTLAHTRVLPSLREEAVVEEGGAVLVVP